MNTYRHRFICACPNNGLQIAYELEITSKTIIHVEHITAATAMHRSGYHEDVADQLHALLGGRHVLRAHHHGVDIETVRGEA